ncbi:MAG: bifunctional 4-hydroxy-2-oxoglutarate aldolase/2-dehydro-3-deoxy-phosphogluconate aldolase [Actinomycetes bacterium]|jgi:2-dehydro-3-deoxyphosphogluconate aldolase / (4S)-4-hydroxy-2-oxoglutarate aldolase
MGKDSSTVELPIDSGLVAIIRSKTENEGREFAQALVEAGVTLIEFTTTTPGAFKLIEEFASKPGLYVGLGTAMNKKHVAKGKAAGAQFVISPHTSKEVIRATKKAGLISIPGVATPTDVANAIEYGADMMKFFPASSLTPGYLKSVRDPFPGQTWLATGGVTLESVEPWIKAGVTAFGLGGPLTSGGISEIAKRVSDFQAAIKSAKGN